MVTPNLNELIESLGVIRRHLCAEGGWSPCDCQYNLLKTNKIKSDKDSCGCCEISQAIIALLGIDERVFQEALRNGNKNEGLYKALFDRNPR